MQRSLAQVVGLLMANPAEAPRKLKSFIKSRVIKPLCLRLPTGLAPSPLAVGLHLTLRCNLRCKQCISLAPRFERQDELTAEQWKLILDKLRPVNPSIYLTGGEPLIVSGVEELIRYAGSLGLSLHLQTNGVFLNRVAQLLVETGTNQVTVSIDGPPEIHDRIRGMPGAGQKSLDNIRELIAIRQRSQSKRPFVDINCCLMADNIASLPEMVDLALDLGIDFLNFQHLIFLPKELQQQHNIIWSQEFIEKNGFDVVPPCLPDSDMFENEITREMLSDILFPALEKARQKARGRLGLSVSPMMPDTSFKHYYHNLAHPFPKTCGYLWEFMRVMPNGRVESCFHVDMGDLSSQPLGDIWNGPSFKRFRLLFKKGLWPGCARCCARSYR